VKRKEWITEGWFVGLCPRTAHARKMFESKGGRFDRFSVDLE